MQITEGRRSFDDDSVHCSKSVYGVSRVTCPRPSDFHVRGPGVEAMQQQTGRREGLAGCSSNQDSTGTEEGASHLLLLYCMHS